MIARATGAALLAAFYVLLLPAAKPVDLLLGLALGAAVVATMGHSPLHGDARESRLHLLWLARLAAWVVWDILTGTWRVSLAVLGARPPHRPGVVDVSLPPSSDKVLVATGVLLTISPATVLVRAALEDHALLVHVVDGDDPDAVRARQQQLHRLVLRTVGG